MSLFEYTVSLNFRERNFYTVRSRYIAVTFLEMTHEIHPLLAGKGEIRLFFVSSKINLSFNIGVVVPCAIPCYIVLRYIYSTVLHFKFDMVLFLRIQCKNMSPLGQVIACHWTDSTQIARIIRYIYRSDFLENIAYLFCNYFLLHCYTIGDWFLVSFEKIKRKYVSISMPRMKTSRLKKKICDVVSPFPTWVIFWQIIFAERW